MAAAAAANGTAAGLQALIFDCDGVIVESEDIHRVAYNATFEHFEVRCPNSGDEPVVWTEEYYDELQNKVGSHRAGSVGQWMQAGLRHSAHLAAGPPGTCACSNMVSSTHADLLHIKRVVGARLHALPSTLPKVETTCLCCTHSHPCRLPKLHHPQVGGGKPKMRHYFGLNGWPTSSVLGGRAPADEAEQTLLIDTLQDWKTEKYKDIIGGWAGGAGVGVLGSFSLAATLRAPRQVRLCVTCPVALYSATCQLARATGPGAHGVCCAALLRPPCPAPHHHPLSYHSRCPAPGPCCRQRPGGRPSRGGAPHG